MNWGDVALRLLIRRRDRDTISGDLLEEYREEVLPRRGPRGARIWYARQVLSFVSPATWGVAIGLVAGSLQLLATAIDPLADDSGGEMIAIAAAMMLFWIGTSVAAGRRSQRFGDAVAAGLVVGIATMAVLHLAAIVRVNVFLDQIRQREDWVHLVSRFRASGVQSLRAYANGEYVRMSPILLALGAVAGTCCGTMGGLLNAFVRAPSAGASRQTR